MSCIFLYDCRLPVIGLYVTSHNLVAPSAARNMWLGMENCLMNDHLGMTWKEVFVA